MAPQDVVFPSQPSGNKASEDPIAVNGGRAISVQAAVRSRVAPSADLDDEDYSAANPDDDYDMVSANEAAATDKEEEEEKEKHIAVERPITKHSFGFLPCPHVPSSYVAMPMDVTGVTTRPLPPPPPPSSPTLPQGPLEGDELEYSRRRFLETIWTFATAGQGDPHSSQSDDTPRNIETKPEASPDAGTPPGSRVKRYRPNPSGSPTSSNSGSPRKAGGLPLGPVEGNATKKYKSSATTD
ncbi:hypothetical protein SEUCBS139899_002126 [Sporothrix eucalyptigena]|uniref:Uncharacterized protein n=1 Tax=Sporothrix eucalyptigena TaxID=1812306 RepID=A0ABP0B4B6_9PEZI